MTPEETSPLLQRLKADPLFSGISNSAMARLLGTVDEVCLPNGEYLYRHQDKATYLYLIETGEVQLTTPSGREVPLAEPRCGEEAVVMEGYVCTAQAQTEVRLLRIPRAALDDLVKAKAKPGFGSQAVQSLLTRVGGEPLQLPIPGKTAKGSTVGLSDIIGWCALLVLPPLLYLLCRSHGFTTQGAIFSAILAATVLMWVFTLVDEFIPPLVALIATLFIGLAPAPVALAGFSSPGMMTLIGVFALSASIGSSGLSYRLMLKLLYLLPDRPVWQDPQEKPHTGDGQV